MHQDDLKFFKNLFMKILRDGVRAEHRQVARVFAEKNLGDNVDLYSADKDRMLALKLEGRKTFYLKKVKSALKRIERGIFGICSECECSIGKSRLMRRPIATKCIVCKEDEERQEEHILYVNKSHTSGRTVCVAS